MILYDFSTQNSPRNQGEVGGDPIHLFLRAGGGGDPQKHLPKVRFLEVFLGT